jgi:hypothetical protein
MAPRTLLGLDLGRPHEFTVLAAVQESGQDGQARTIWSLPLLRRWPLGTPYPEIVTAVARIIGRLQQPALVVDATGVGEAIVDLFRQAALPVEELVSVTVTAGQGAHKAAWDRWSCPRKDLAGAVQSVLQGRRLRIAKGLREAVTLTRELSAFRMKPPSGGEETLDTWRERDQDDLVLAVALAVWMGEFGAPPEMNVVHLRLDRPPASSALAPPVVFPEVRYFAPPHCSSRNAASRAGSRSTAWWNSSSTRRGEGSAIGGSRAGVPGSAESVQKPDTDVAPLPIQRPLRQAEDFRRLSRRQPAEVA